ncbi:hypothetical protein JW758_01525 [Candidatus Peregrinibacteria bacterium]|nr:hypothetical protein [Candidatus Peregrinibacteria bacterium]
MQNIYEQHKDAVIDPNTQQMLNEPLVDKTGFNEGHEEFIKMLKAKLESGELETHTPDTLYNHEVYDRLSEEDQEKASLTAINLMSTIRQLETLWKLGQSATFQIQNLVETVFQMKSKFEEQHGDVYII